MDRKEVIEKLKRIDEDPRNGTPEENQRLLSRLQKTANQAKHSGWYPTITQIKMCINCVYRAHHSFESGFCSYTDVTGKDNGIRTFGICQVYEMDPKKRAIAIDKDLETMQNITRPKNVGRPTNNEAVRPKRRPR